MSLELPDLGLNFGSRIEETGLTITCLAISTVPPHVCRVLLTRALQGMVIFVLPGDQRDPTRSPDFYD
jgi:hypothetical protein